MKLKSIIFWLALSLPFFISAQTLDPNTTPSVQRSVDDHGLQGISVSYKINDYRIDVADMDKDALKFGPFQRILIENFSHIQVPGQAALPSHMDIIAVPQGADYQLKTNSSKSKELKGFHIYPAREPARDTEGAGEPAFEYDEKYYSTDAFFPQENVRVVEEIELRGLSYLIVEINPVQYNPAKGTIRIHQEVQYEVQFSSATQFLDYTQHSSAAINNIAATPLNGASIIKGAPNHQNQLQAAHLPINYLIITQNGLLDAADTLAKWKRQMGYGVEIITANSWTAANVKSEIHNRYQNYSPKPDYFVILGDIQHVPAETFTSPDGSGTYGSDLYYACMGGTSDYVPDMAHGRISIANATEAMTVVQKIVNYERSPINDTAFYAHGLNCAQYQDDDNNGFADRRFTHTSEDVRDYMMTQNYTIQRIYYTDNNVYPIKYNASYYSTGQNIPSALLKTNGYAWNGGSTDIRNAINSGKFYVLHRDHGFAGGSGWAHPYFTSSGVNTLSNGDKLPVVFSINCHTGEFTLSNCFAERFLRHSNGGAVGIFAASYYSYSGYNDGLSVGMFDAIWSNPGVVPAFGTGGISSPQITAHNDIIHMGWVLNHGKLRMTQTWGGNQSGRRYSNELFHYFGDPAMRMWTKAPMPIIAQHDSIINCSDSIFQIAYVSDSMATASLMFQDELLASAQLVNGSGNIFIPTVVGDTLLLTITARDKIPYTALIKVNSTGGMNLNSYSSPNTCYNDSTGSIQLIPSCGQPPYQVQWADGDTNFYRSNLPGGEYIVTVSDSTISITDTITVWAPLSPLSSNPLVFDAQCYFESSGSVVLNVSGGAPPYDYQWSNGSTSSMADNLAAGSINVLVTDSMGCTFYQSFNIDQPNPLDLSTTHTDDIDNACIGTGTAVVTGGVPPYQYSWNDPNNQTSVTATGLCPGLYKVSVVDSNQCSQYRTIIVSNTVGMEENTETLIKVFPNPAQDVLNIQLDDKSVNEVVVRIYNSLGQEVINVRKDLSSGQTDIDLSSLSSGHYIISIESNTHEVLSKVRFQKIKN